MLTIDIDIARRFILSKQGLWLEDEGLGEDETFAKALAGGFDRFATFLGVSQLDADAIQEPMLRRRVCAS